MHQHTSKKVDLATILKKRDKRKIYSATGGRSSMMILGMCGNPKAQTIEYIFKGALRKTTKRFSGFPRE